VAGSNPLVESTTPHVDRNLPGSFVQLQVSDLLRPLVLYMQYGLILASVTSVELPAPLAYPLQALAWAWSPAVPGTLSIECILPHGSSSSIPVAIQRMLFYLAMPVVMLVLLLAAEASVFKLFRSRHAAVVGVRDRLGSSAMVVCFFFLPSILRSTFGWFACIPIDAPAAAPYAAGAVGSFWLHDPDQRCYQGYHRAWAFGLGLPLLVLVCGLLPASILWVVLRNKQHLTDPAFMRHYGFLVRPYMHDYCWWEVAVLGQMVLLIIINPCKPYHLQMVLLIAVSVFSYSLRPLQDMVMIFALTAVAVSLIACKPYAQPAAGRTMLLGVYCLLLTSLGMWSFSAFQGFVPGAAYRVAVGTLLLMVNSAYAASVVWQLAKQVDWSQVKKGMLAMVAWCRELSAGVASKCRR
jgi:hypothetical protein